MERRRVRGSQAPAARRRQRARPRADHRCRCPARRRAHGRAAGICFAAPPRPPLRPSGSARYKDHLLLTTWEGPDERTSPTLWIRIDAHQAGFASGLGFTPTLRKRWRAAIGGGSGATLATDLGHLVERRRAEIAGERTKNVPAPYGTDHPRAELLRLTGFQVRFTDDLPDTVSTPSFADWCAERLEELLPVHCWLVARITTLLEES